MLRKSKFALLTLVLVLALAQVASAGLSAVGPFNATGTSNGFPMWYRDANGVTLDLPVPPIGDLVTPPTMIYGPVPLGNTNPVITHAGFDTEAFYFIARPDPKGFQTAYGRIACTLGVEASYVNGIPTDGQQMVFSRIRIKAPVKVAGTYTFFHPWGTETINVTAADIAGTNKGIFYTVDAGLTPGWLPDLITPVASPLGFYGVLQPANKMSTFLKATTMSPLASPLQWIGDGVTLTTVTGSPTLYNKVRLEGPDTNLDGKGHNFVETSLFVVSGHIAQNLAAPTPLIVNRVTCSHIGTVENLDVWFSSIQGATVAINDVNPVNQNIGALLFSGSVTDLSGKFYASFPGTSKLVAITVTPPLGSTLAPITKIVSVTDYVNIIQAAYNQTTKTLTIQATSSDYFFTTKRGLAPPVLTATGLGTLTIVDAVNGIYSLAVSYLTNPSLLPPTVNVTSSIGGTVTVMTAMQ